MPTFVVTICKSVWEAADAEEMPRERAIAAIARDGKLPGKDPQSPFAGLK